MSDQGCGKGAGHHNVDPTAGNTPYPEHARNYMAQEIKLPLPRIHPHRVAEAILQTAVEGGRDVKVDDMAVLDMLASKLLPGVGDNGAKQANRQQQDNVARSPEGSLFHPGVTGSVYGPGEGVNHRKSV